MLQFLFPDAKDPLEKAKDDRENENSENNNNPKYVALLEVRLIWISLLNTMIRDLTNKSTKLSTNALCCHGNMKWSWIPFICNLYIFPLISARNIFSINGMTMILKIMSVWRQTHYDINDKNNTVNFWYLNLHKCHYSIYKDDKTTSIRLHFFCLTLSTVCFKLMRIDCKHDLRLQVSVSYQLKGYDNTY